MNMPDNRDFRIRAYLYIKNEGVARGLYNHVMGLWDEAVDINPDSPHAEMRKVEIGGSYIVNYDLCFPPDKQTEAEGIFNHTKNMAENHATKVPNAGEVGETGYVSLERCGHRTKQQCEMNVERYEVV